MNESLNKYIGAEEGMPSQAIKPSVTEALEREKRGLLERLLDIEEALMVLREHPDIQKVIDVVSKHTRF